MATIQGGETIGFKPQEMSSQNLPPSMLKSLEVLKMKQPREHQRTTKNPARSKRTR